jgi:hypothetical protein
MHLPGRLASSTLGDLLGALHRERVTGTVELHERPSRFGGAERLHRVHLRGGLVAGVETPLPVPPLGEVLRREGLASSEAVRELVTRIRAGDARFAGEILTNRGLVSPDAVRAALRAQLRERIEALFTIVDAKIAFRTARPQAGGATPTPLEPAEFLHGKPRSRDGSRPRPEPARARPLDEPLADEPLADEPRARARRLLGIPRDAGPSDVRRAFRRIAGPLHPDRVPHVGDAERAAYVARFAELAAAYHLLVA